jgi:D-arabinose 1-dehydrogenase-like Zn-dependent alcohol dehydrogenase
MHGVREPLTVTELPDPTLEPHGAIVRVEANGVCRSDWHGWVGDWDWVGVEFEYPHVLGHEFCGVVEEVGSEVRRFKAGDRVIVPFSQGDGTCEMCRTGHSNVCENGFAPGFSYWGGFGRLSHVPVADLNLVRMPDSMSFLVGAALGCRYMTSFHGVAHRAEVHAGEWVAVHGCGGIGLSAIQVAAALGAQVIAVDLEEGKLSKARAEGALETINAMETDVPMRVKEITDGGANVSVDALGIKATMLNSVNSLRKGGIHVQIGITSADEAGEVALPIDLITMSEIEFRGSLGLPNQNYPSMLNMVASGKLNPESIVTQRISINEVPDIVDSMTTFQTMGFVTITDFS